MTTDFNKVMIIDDNSIDLYITSILMRKQFFASEILQYSAATNALEYLKRNVNAPNEIPEIILVDIYMPEMSGFEFMDAYDHLPDAVKNRSKVYIVSSSIDQSDIGRANNDRNVISFQEKPITPEFLNSIARA